MLRGGAAGAQNAMTPALMQLLQASPAGGQGMDAYGAVGPGTMSAPMPQGPVSQPGKSYAEPLGFGDPLSGGLESLYKATLSDDWMTESRRGIDRAKGRAQRSAEAIAAGAHGIRDQATLGPPREANAGGLLEALSAMPGGKPDMTLMQGRSDRTPEQRAATPNTWAEMMQYMDDTDGWVTAERELESQLAPLQHP
jgi:hypothetical protein